MHAGIVRERYAPVVVAANSTVAITSNSTGCFLCQVSGTITLTTNAQDGKAATTLLNAFPVTAGIYYPLPFYLSANGGSFTTAGGAAGLLGV